VERNHNYLSWNETENQHNFEKSLLITKSNVVIIMEDSKRCNLMIKLLMYFLFHWLIGWQDLDTSSRRSSAMETLERPKSSSGV
jgi:hypothetical protein